MAIAGSAIWEVRTTGSATNGGAYVSGGGGTDWSQQNTPQYAVTDAVANGTTTITSATASFGTDVVGNAVYLQGGTGSLAASWYQVTSRTSATAIVLDRTVATGTGITLNLGGALNNPGSVKATGQNASGQIIYIKSGTYSVSTATNNVDGGTINDTNQCLYVGYDTNRNILNTDTKPIIQYNASTITYTSTRSIFVNLTFDGNAQTAAKLCAGTPDAFYRCKIQAMNTLAGNASYTFCEFTTCSAAFVGRFFGCEFYANTATVAGNSSTTSSFTSCISRSNTGASTDGFDISSQGCFSTNCVSYANGRHGFQFNPASRASTAINCHAENNGGFGYNTQSGNAHLLINCSAYNNTSGAVGTKGTAFYEQGFITVTAGSVFANAAGGDFSLNNTTNQGALLRATGFPSAFPASTGTANYLDIGAAQHQDTGGGGTTFIYNLTE